jgi:hypothetical protein
MLFDRPHTRVRTHFGSFDLVTLVQPHSFNEVRVASNHFVLPSGHNSVLPCHGSVLLSIFFGGGAVKLQLFLCCNCLQVFSLSEQDVEFFRIDFQASIMKLLKNLSRLSSHRSRAI